LYLETKIEVNLKVALKAKSTKNCVIFSRLLFAFVLDLFNKIERAISITIINNINIVKEHYSFNIFPIFIMKREDLQTILKSN
jgi:hypothetical protein